MTQYDEGILLQITADNLRTRLKNIVESANAINPDTPAKIAGFIRKNIESRADNVRKQLAELAELGITPSPAAPSPEA
jgi:hypothetical protein